MYSKSFAEQNPRCGEATSRTTKNKTFENELIFEIHIISKNNIGNNDYRQKDNN